MTVKIKYLPNKNAVALRTNKSKSIAVILPNVNDLLCSQILTDIQIGASKSGYRIVLFQSFIKNKRNYLNQINDGSVAYMTNEILNPSNTGTFHNNQFQKLRCLAKRIRGNTQRKSRNRFRLPGDLLAVTKSSIEGEPVALSTTKTFGCSVNWASREVTLQDKAIAGLKELMKNNPNEKNYSLYNFNSSNDINQCTRNHTALRR